MTPEEPEDLDDQGPGTGDHVPDPRLSTPVTTRRDTRGPDR